MLNGIELGKISREMTSNLKAHWKLVRKSGSNLTGHHMMLLPWSPGSPKAMFFFFF